MPDETNCQTGWLGRALDKHCDPTAAHDPAVFVGRIARPLALNAERVFVPSVRSLEECTLKVVGGSGAGQPEQQLPAGKAETARPGNGNPLLDFVQDGIRSAHTASGKVAEVAGRSTSGRTYPPFQLAQSLRIVAQLIRAELGIRVFFTELGGGSPGGFDNHANQLGNHDALLRELSESVAALADDLKHDRLLDRVVLMTFSEFGRTLVENGRRGTGHGEAAPMFLVGGALRGGLVGPHPNLTDLRKGSPKFHTDFRRVYATMLDGWLGLDSQAVLGRRFEPLDVLA